MKKHILLLLIPVLGWTCALAQTFDLNSTDFALGDTYISHPKIIFAFDSDSILEMNFDHLDSIAKFIVQHDSLIIEIGVHSDSRFSQAYSMRPILRRANKLVDYFVNAGVDQERLIAVGYNSTQLLISKEEIDKMETLEEKEEAEEMNRRVEFNVVGVR